MKAHRSEPRRERLRQRIAVEALRQLRTNIFALVGDSSLFDDGKIRNGAGIRSGFPRTESITRPFEKLKCERTKWARTGEADDLEANSDVGSDCNDAYRERSRPGCI
jgi:hypothetical protein